MTTELDLTSFRFVDSHMHHWDPANTQWYPFLDPDFDLAELGIPGAEAMRRRFLVEDYLAEAGPWQLDKYVHVNATGGPKAYLDEAEWLAGLGGRLAGVIGTVDLEQDTGDVLADLKAQAEHPLFRGIRNMQIPDFRAPAFDAALGFLAEGGFVYDFLVHPATMADAVEVIHRHPDLDVVVEHVGWPTSTDDAERALWREGMRALADTRDGVACKVSGIAMTTHTLTVDAVRPWFDETIALFGLERCLAGSNFPVDGAFGTFDQLMRSYLAIIGEHGDAAMSAVFADNAERIYRI
jgi:L-fuconolactonase